MNKNTLRLLVSFLLLSGILHSSFVEDNEKSAMYNNPILKKMVEKLANETFLSQAKKDEYGCLIVHLDYYQTTNGTKIKKSVMYDPKLDRTQLTIANLSNPQQPYNSSTNSFEGKNVFNIYALANEEVTKDMYRKPSLKTKVIRRK